MYKLILLIIAYKAAIFPAASQDEFYSGLMVGVFGGGINYQGDLKPNSFTFQHSHPVLSLSIRKPLNRWFSLRTGGLVGKIEAADKHNREYLRFRNLSFASSIKELYGVLEIDLLDFTSKKFTPYVHGGGALFHFNSYTIYNGERVFLQPLSTEGQGLAAYPERKPYKSTQFTLAFGGGFRFAVSNCTSLSVEFNQRKTFTDYLDDVSTGYIDQNVLFTSRGQLAVDVAYRTDEYNGAPYPAVEEQRGTPTEDDWYYFIGISAETRLSCIKTKVFTLLKQTNRNWRYTKCPKFY